MKGKLFRIAHLGYYDYMDTIGIIAALEHVLAMWRARGTWSIGLALKAAQEVYARAVARSSGRGWSQEICPERATALRRSHEVEFYSRVSHIRELQP